MITSFVIDEGIWFVHRRHLQTEADAAAFAGARNFQYPCESAVESKIKETVHQYDGTKPGYNPQEPLASAGGLVSEVNKPNYYGQSQPGEAELSGSLCNDAAIDVKMSEVGPASYFPFVKPAYITAHSRVSIVKESGAIHAEPFAEPLPTPNTMTATLVDQSNNDSVIAGPVTLTSSGNHTAWTNASPISVPFNAAKAGALVGLRVAMSGGSTATCGSSGTNCYATDAVAPALGVAYTRVWSNSGSPGLPLSEPVAPQAGEVTLAPAEAEGCPSAPSGTFSNFISTSASCKVVLSARMTFTSPGGATLNCGTGTLTLKAGTGNIAMTCPAGGPNGTWTSAPITVTPNAGPTAFTLSWSLKTGKKPAGGGVEGGDSTGTCTSAKPCTGSFDGASAKAPETVQRIYSGAYDSQSEATSHSGPILSATVAEASSGSELLSLQRTASATSVNITVTVLGFQNSEAIPSPPVELSFGGNQENAALQCGGNAGNPEFEAALVEGCATEYGTTSAPAATACEGSPEPPVCVKENPGGGKLEKDLDKSMNQRINEGRNACVNPNHWASPNTVTQVVSQSPADPRLIVTIITDYGALNNGSSSVPIRTFAEFYVTGWSGDPCIGQGNGTSSNGLAYTHDDNPGSNTGVLLGHFVKYVSQSSTGKGTEKCDATEFGNCIAVLTR